MQNVVLGAYAFKLTDSPAFVGARVLRAARPAAVPVDAGRAARRHRRPPPLPRQRAARAGAASRSVSPRIVVDERSVAGRARRASCSRSASRTRSARPGSARSCRRSCRAKTCPARSRSTSVQMNLSRVIGPVIGALDLHALRRGAGVRDQRADVPVRGHRSALGEVPAAHRTRVVAERGFARLLSGVRIARRDPLLTHAPASRCSRSRSSRSRSSA